MRLYELSVGHRFSFTDKQRGKVFEVTQRAPRAVHYTDTATGDERMATDSAKAFRMEVELVTANRVVEFTPQEAFELAGIIYDRYILMCEEGYSEISKSHVNKLYVKLTGLPVRRVDKPED